MLIYNINIEVYIYIYIYIQNHVSIFNEYFYLILIYLSVRFSIYIKKKIIHIGYLIYKNFI